MKYEDVQTALEGYFQGVWSLTPLTFENILFDSSEVSEFARLSVQFGEPVQRSLGSSCYRIIGVVFLQIFIKPNIGTFRIGELADAASELLANKLVAVNTDYVHLFLPSLVKTTSARDGWVMGNLSCPFYFDSEIV